MNITKLKVNKPEKTLKILLESEGYDNSCLNYYIIFPLT